MVRHTSSYGDSFVDRITVGAALGRDSYIDDAVAFTFTPTKGTLTAVTLIEEL